MLTIRYLANLVQLVEIVVAVVLIVACVGGLPFGIKPYITKSGSMEPAVQTGSLAYVDRNIERDSLTVGDIAAFKVTGSKIVSHRVLSNDPKAGTITTKGDANDNADPPVRYENVVGEVLFSIPYLGFVFAFMQQHWLLLAVWLASGNALLLLASRKPLSRAERGEKDNDEEEDTPPENGGSSELSGRRTDGASHARVSD